MAEKEHNIPKKYDDKHKERHLKHTNLSEDNKKISEWKKKYYQLNKERIKKQMKDYYDKNRDRICERERLKYRTKKKRCNLETESFEE